MKMRSGELHKLSTKAPKTLNYSTGMYGSSKKAPGIIPSSRTCTLLHPHKSLGILTRFVVLRPLCFHVLSSICVAQVLGKTQMKQGCRLDWALLHTRMLYGCLHQRSACQRRLKARAIPTHQLLSDLVLGVSMWCRKHLMVIAKKFTFDDAPNRFYIGYNFTIHYENNFLHVLTPD